MRGRTFLPLLMLAGCSGEPAPTPTPTPAGRTIPVSTPVPSPRPLQPGQLAAPELDGVSPLDGDWRGSRDGAIFTAAGRVAFAIRCDRSAGRILLSRGVGAGTSLRLFTDSAAATFAAQVVDGSVEAPVTTGQTFLDALGRADAIGVAVGDGPVARIPGDPAIGAVVRGCRPAGR